MKIKPKQLPKPVWFHYGDVNLRTHVLKPLRLCNGHTRGIEGVTACSDIQRLVSRYKGS